MGAGRPSKLTEEVLQIAIDYAENFEMHDHAIPSVVGLAKVLKVHRDTIYGWVEDTEGDELKQQFSYILGVINNNQHFELVNGGLKNKLNPQITKLVLGKHGYHEQHKQEISGPDGGPIEGNVVFVGATETD